MNVANVNAFITILVGKLTQYDDRQNKKHYNAYRLGHYLEAANKVRTDCSRAAILQRDDPEAMLKLEASIRHHFIADSMPPAKSTLKQIHEWLKDKKLPKYPTGYKYTEPGPAAGGSPHSPRASHLQSRHAAHSPAGHLRIGTWYCHASAGSFGNRDTWFHPLSEQKNGKLAGVLVEVDRVRPRAKPKARKASWAQRDASWFQEATPPPAVREAARQHMAPKEPCTKHSDCIDHPRIGWACTRQDTARTLSSLSPRVPGMQKRGGAEHPYLISFTLHGKIIDGWIWAPSERAAKHRLENELGGDAFDIRSIKLDQSGRAPRPGEYEHSRGSRYFVRKLPGMIGSPRASHRATRPAPNGNALGSMLHKGASKIASLVTGKRGR